MQPKHNISRYKQKLLIFLSALFIALILQPNQEVYANDYVGVVLDALGYNGSGATVTIKNGVTYAKTGYLCYLVKAEGGNIPGMTAYAFHSAGYSAYSGSRWQVTSKQVPTGGAYTASEWKGVAPWQVTPFNIDKSTNVEQIRAWTRQMDGDKENGTQFIYDNWGEEVATRFVNGEYVLVIETLLNFQFSDKLAAGEPIQITYEEARAILTTIYGEEFVNAMMESTIRGIATAVNAELSKNSAGGWKTVGSPLIGTCSDFIDYYHELKEGGYVKANYFSLYTNKVAPFAEMIHQGEAGEKAGFIPWTGGISSEVPDSVVPNYGVAVMVLKATADAQTTCDESLAGDPHNPPKESEGKVTIVKSYRTKDPTGALIDDGTFHLKDLGTQILIENEQTYQVIGWKTSTTTNTGIKSTSWNPPSSVVQQGTTPKSVTLQPTETCLYVLLEKIEEEEVEPLDWNYRLTESSITRTVWFSNPDNPLSNMNSPYIQDHPFQWTAVAHQECPGHTYYGPCQTTHDAPCDCSGLCSSPCKLKTTDPTHVCVTCTKSHKYNCGSRDCPDQPRTAYCKGWQWKEKQLFLSINNLYQNNYPDILATKEGWNSEVREGGIIKHYYRNDSKFDRLSKSTQTYTDNGWDYVCILMRGKDKLTLAEWQNNGEGNNAANNANDDLRDASSSGFTVANTDSGTRKTTDYYETFNTYFGTEHNEGVDNETTWWATIDAVDEDGNSLGKHTDVRGAYVSSPLSVNNIVVKVETYSGTASEHKNDTTCHDGDLYYPLPGYTTSSGRMVKSGGIISFTPYIEMKYDTLPAYNLQAYVLSEFTTQITPNDYAELSWNQTDESNLSLISAQWSTHADACQDWGADNVLPGGATLSLNIKKDARQKVAVTTWQCIITDRDGFHGKTHVEKT